MLDKQRFLLEMRETQVNQTFLQLLGVDGVLKSQEQSQSLRLDNDNE